MLFRIYYFGFIKHITLSKQHHENFIIYCFVLIIHSTLIKRARSRLVRNNENRQYFHHFDEISVIK